MATYTDNYNLTKPTMSELADIRTINGNMDTIDEIMHGSQVSIADAYDPTHTYAVDDLVMYDFLLYKCITAVSTPEAFDPTKWERTTAAAEGSGGGGSGLPSGGTAGQYLVKRSATEGDADWQSLNAFTGATSEAAGAAGLVPAPSSEDQNKFLKADGTWSTPAGGGGSSISTLYCNMTKTGEVIGGNSSLTLTFWNYNWTGKTIKGFAVESVNDGSGNDLSNVIPTKFSMDSNGHPLITFLVVGSTSTVGGIKGVLFYE